MSAPEFKKLQGTWKVSKAVKEGEPETAARIEKMQIAILGDKITFKPENKEDKEEVMRFSVDPTKKPATIDSALMRSLGHREGTYRERHL